MFRVASPSEINAVSEKYTLIPVVGLWDSAPVCLDVYQIDVATPWIMPTLADVMQIDACVKSNREDTVYHFLVWQHTKTERNEADLVVYYSPL